MGKSIFNTVNCPSKLRRANLKFGAWNKTVYYFFIFKSRFEIIQEWRNAVRAVTYCKRTVTQRNRDLGHVTILKKKNMGKAKGRLFSQLGDLLWRLFFGRENRECDFKNTFNVLLVGWITLHKSYTCWEAFSQERPTNTES